MVQQEQNRSSAAFAQRKKSKYRNDHQLAAEHSAPEQLAVSANASGSLQLQ
jgi:hypothetical protein